MFKSLQCAMLTASVLAVSLFGGKNIGLTKEIENMREGVIYTLEEEQVYTDGFWVEEDETVYLLKSYESSVMELKKKSTREIPLSASVLPADVISLEDNLYVFDDILYELQIYTKQGELLVRSKIELKEDYVKGLTLTEDGVAVLTYGGHAITVDPETGKQNIRKIEAEASVDAADYDFAEHIGTAEDGSVYAVHTTLVQDCSIISGELELRVTSAEGEFLGSYVLPVQEYAYLPGTYAQVLPNGNIYLMVPTEQSVEIRKIALKETVESQMEAISETVTEKESAYTADTRYRKRNGLSCTEKVDVSRDEAWKRAREMAEYQWTLKKTHTLVSKSEKGVVLPREIAAIKEANKETNSWSATITGIPYCWGGFYALDVGFKERTFQTVIDKSYVAGNINPEGYYKYMTAGLDCSGFVSATLGFGGKQSTRGLSDLGSKVSDVRKMENMDILVHPGEHVIFFCGWVNETTMLVCESAVREGKVSVHPKSLNELVVNSRYQMRSPW